MKKHLLIISLLFVTMTTANAAELIVNGSFEDPAISEGTWDVFYGNEVDGWSLDSAGVEIRNNVAGTAYDGSNFVELDTHHADNTNSGIYQTISTAAGQAYQLSFAYAPRINQGIDTNGINVFWGDDLVTSISKSGIGGSTWEIVTAILYGTGSDINLKFSAFEAGADDTLGGSLDLVSLTAVPVPAAVWLFVSGLLGLFGYSRKKAA